MAKSQRPVVMDKLSSSVVTRFYMTTTKDLYLCLMVVDVICIVGLIQIEEDGAKENPQKDYCLSSITYTYASRKQHYRRGPLQLFK